MRKVAAQEMSSIEDLRRLYSNVSNFAFLSADLQSDSRFSPIAVVRRFFALCTVRTPIGQSHSCFTNSTLRTFSHVFEFLPLISKSIESKRMFLLTLPILQFRCLEQQQITLTLKRHDPWFVLTQPILLSFGQFGSLTKLPGESRAFLEKVILTWRNTIGEG